MTHEEVQRWLDSYVSAWRSNDREEIAELFSEDAVYSYRPWESEDKTERGRDAIVASWLDSPDDPGSWDAEYRPYAVEGDRAAAVGWSRYAASEEDPDRTYHNVFLLTFDEEGRCSTFHEFWMLEGR